MHYAGTRQRWLYRLLACCGFTLGGMGFEGMWGDALKADSRALSHHSLTKS
ncbi:hypothetical protein GCM10007905_34640 [Mixta theicola]|nr:hypothetical protein GCM10007905_34640 [Mixta theicola]